jgi:large subunit ribosomal protein L22
MKAVAKNIRVSPRKIRLLTKDLVGKNAADVMARLKFVNKSARPPVLEALKSAVANSKITADKLFIKSIIVNEGIKMKRAAKGRNAKADRGVVQKRTSHLKIMLVEGSSL